MLKKDFKLDQVMPPEKKEGKEKIEGINWEDDSIEEIIKKTAINILGEEPDEKLSESLLMQLRGLCNLAKGSPGNKKMQETINERTKEIIENWKSGQEQKERLQA